MVKHISMLVMCFMLYMIGYIIATPARDRKYLLFIYLIITYYDKSHTYYIYGVSYYLDD